MASSTTAEIGRPARAASAAALSRARRLTRMVVVEVVMTGVYRENVDRSAPPPSRGRRPKAGGGLKTAPTASSVPSLRAIPLRSVAGPPPPRGGRRRWSRTSARPPQRLRQRRRQRRLLEPEPHG